MLKGDGVLAPTTRYIGFHLVLASTHPGGVVAFGDFDTTEALREAGGVLTTETPEIVVPLAEVFAGLEE